MEAQNTALNKQQTIAYINKLYKIAYRYKETKIDTVTVDGKVLTVFLSTGQHYRSDLSKSEPLVIARVKSGYQIRYKSAANTEEILWAIQTEDDAKRLQKAVQHLIGILKIEKKTDPFGS
ncbi:hypothetical protein KUH03_26210 [Sphingobacterium sp. E70]|uniref:Uncharacterized protein n=1 Tax=Sphingobacterium ginsenosidimutans TaxID=687845 RepID=A0ABP8AKR6_9SPHI|nr:hypothetical protein [Sphingobacterium sp. E70]ULT22788.1 hypothetical protein KUH03_26210 [Sphingobacterium sp. E70]